MTDFHIKSLIGTEKANNSWFKCDETEFLTVSVEALNTYGISFFRLLIVVK